MLCVAITRRSWDMAVSLRGHCSELVEYIPRPNDHHRLRTARRFDFATTFYPHHYESSEDNCIPMPKLTNSISSLMTKVLVMDLTFLRDWVLEIRYFKNRKKNQPYVNYTERILWQFVFLLGSDLLSMAIIITLSTSIRNISIYIVNIHIFLYAFDDLTF